MEKCLLLCLSLLLVGCGPSPESESENDAAIVPLEEKVSDCCEIDSVTALDADHVGDVASYRGALFINQATKTHGLVLHVYRDGELKRTLSSPYNTYDELSRIGRRAFSVGVWNRSFAEHESLSEYDIMVTYDYGECSYNISKDDFNIDGGSVAGVFGHFIERDGLLPLFYITEASADDRPFSVDSIDALLARSDETFVIVGSLVVEE